MSRMILVFAFVGLVNAPAFTQQNAKPSPAQRNVTAVSAGNPAAKATAAYAEVMARKVETEVELQILLTDYNEDSPQVREKRVELSMLERGLKAIEAMTGENLSRLTPAFGRLYVRRIQAETELKILTDTYAEEHPQVKKARIRYNVYVEALRKLL